MTFSVRRFVALAAALVAFGLPLEGEQVVAQGGDVQEGETASQIKYKGYLVDIASIQTLRNRNDIVAALRRQIDIVENVTLNKDKHEFFKSVPIAIVKTERGHPGASGAYRGRKRSITLRPEVYDKDRPILLHELMHAYHHQKLPGGTKNADLLHFFRRARGSHLFPAGSYMLSNVKEYFAMTSSAYLHGSAARDPFTRENLKSKQPQYFQWLEKEFGPR